MQTVQQTIEWHKTSEGLPERTKPGGGSSIELLIYTRERGVQYAIQMHWRPANIPATLCWFTWPDFVWIPDPLAWAYVPVPDPEMFE